MPAETIADLLPTVVAELEADLASEDVDIRLRAAQIVCDYLAAQAQLVAP